MQLTSQAGHHFRRTLTGPDLRLEIHPTEDRDEIRGQIGSVPVALDAGPEERISGTLGGERFSATIVTLEDGRMEVTGALGAMPLRESIVPMGEGFVLTGTLGPHLIHQEVRRDPRA